MYRNNILTFVIIAVVSAFCSCNRSTVYSQYRHTSLAGWERNDTLTFSVAKMKEDVSLRATLGLRVNDSFPFKTLCLIVEKTVSPDNIVTCDTVNCKLFDEDGKSMGRGVSYYQYNVHFTNTKLLKGDSLTIKVRHNMKREIMPGIADVGITLEKAQ